MTTALVLGVVVLVIVPIAIIAAVVAISAFNKLRTQDVAVDEALSGIDVQLTKRAELVPNLVETVKGYAAHEKGLFESVTKARAEATAASGGGSSVGARAAADANMQRAVASMIAVAENYPELKASSNFQELQRQLTGIEDELSFARRYYNDAVSSLNTSVTTFPGAMFASMARVGQREFYKAPEGHTEAPSVSF